MNPWRGLRGLPVEVWVLFVTTLVNRMGTMVLPFLVLYLTRHLGYPASSAGLVLAVFGAASLASAPFAGRLCDRVGALPVMERALLGSGALLVIFPLVRRYELILLLTALWAVIGEAVRPASLVAITEATGPEQRKGAIALNRLAINLGMSVGPAVGGFLAMVSFPLLFVVDGVSSILAGLVLAGFLWRLGRRGPHARAAHRLAREAAAAAAPEAAGGVLRDRRMLFFFAGVILVGIVFFQHEAAMPLFLVRDLGLPESFYGMLFVVNTLLIVALEVPLNLWMADWPHRRALALGALLIALGFGALAFSAGPWSVAATVVVWTFGEMILFPVMATYVADAAPAARRGAYMGAYTMAFGVAFTVGPWLGTALLDRYGAVTLWGAIFACGAASALIMARVADVGPVPAGSPAAAA